MATAARAPIKVTPPAAPTLHPRVKGEYEPLLLTEKKLIWYTFGAGIVLLALLVAVSRHFM